MHFEEVESANGQVTGRLASVYEGARFLVGINVYLAADGQITATASGQSIEDLQAAVGVHDPETAPEVITVDREAYLKIVDDGTTIHQGGRLTILELVPPPSAEQPN